MTTLLFLFVSSTCHQPVQWDEAHYARHQSSKTQSYKINSDDVIMMVIESDSRVMTEVTLHTKFIYINTRLGKEDKLDIALIHLLKL